MYLKLKNTGRTCEQGQPSFNASGIVEPSISLLQDFPRILTCASRSRASQGSWPEFPFCLSAANRYTSICLHPPRRRPTGGLVEKTLVPHDWFVTGTPHWARQQFRHIPFQALIGRDADGVLQAPAFQRFINLRLGKGGVGAKHPCCAEELPRPRRAICPRVFHCIRESKPTESGAYSIFGITLDRKHALQVAFS